MVHSRPHQTIQYANTERDTDSADLLILYLRNHYGDRPYSDREILDALLKEDQADLRAYAKEGLSHEEMMKLNLVRLRLGYAANDTAKEEEELNRLSELAKVMAKQRLMRRQE
jgi:hypothetical protein